MNIIYSDKDTNTPPADAMVMIVPDLIPSRNSKDVLVSMEIPYYDNYNELLKRTIPKDNT